MFPHPDITIALGDQHRRELLADAERGRLLALAKQHRRDRKLARKAIEQQRASAADGSLAACGEHVPAPVRWSSAGTAS